MKLAVWNLRFASPRGKFFPEILRRLETHAPDIGIFSEVTLKGVPEGNVIFGHDDWGYVSKGHHRKVSMASRQGWSSVGRASDERPLQGRFLTGETRLGDRAVSVISICIPWSLCHVSSGARDSEPWQEHKAFLRALPAELDRLCKTDNPVILAGDFNQTFPAERIDWDAHEMLVDTLAAFDLEVMTSGHAGEGRLLNHIAVRGLKWKSFSLLDNQSDIGELTDHLGAVVEVEA